MHLEYIWIFDKKCRFIQKPKNGKKWQKSGFRKSRKIRFMHGFEKCSKMDMGRIDKNGVFPKIDILLNPENWEIWDSHKKRDFGTIRYSMILDLSLYPNDVCVYGRPNRSVRPRFSGSPDSIGSPNFVLDQSIDSPIPHYSMDHWIHDSTWISISIQIK